MTSEITETMKILIAPDPVQVSRTQVHSMAWFDGAVYIGTNSLDALDTKDPPRIIRIDPASGEWEEVYRAPLVPVGPRAFVPDRQIGAQNARAAQMVAQYRRNRGAETMPREFGYRGMAVFQGESDPGPCLYVTTASTFGGRLLRSEDGRTFEVISEPGLGDDTILSFISPASFDGRLLLAPCGSITEEGLERNLSSVCQIFASRDPVKNVWEPACERNFGDPENDGVTRLTVWDGRLHAGVVNVERGFQVWATDTLGNGGAWTRLMADGAYRFCLNQCVTAMAGLGDALYVGTGLPGFGEDKANDVGPAAAELIRIYPDGRWDLIVGTPRFTPDGFKVPLSGMGPGYDDFYNSVFWAAASHGDGLYVGTHQWEAMHQLQNGDPGPLRGGFELWGTRDGEDWTRIATGGAGNTDSTGIRRLVSTPHGLCIGIFNHLPLMQRMARNNSSAAEMRSDSGIEVYILE